MPVGVYPIPNYPDRYIQIPNWTPKGMGTWEVCKASYRFSWYRVDPKFFEGNM